MRPTLAGIVAHRAKAIQKRGYLYLASCPNTQHNKRLVAASAHWLSLGEFPVGYSEAASKGMQRTCRVWNSPITHSYFKNCAARIQRSRDSPQRLVALCELEIALEKHVGGVGGVFTCQPVQVPTAILDQGRSFFII